MGLFHQVIKAALVAGAPGALREVKPELLVDDELPLYDFVQQHLNEHGVIPSEETLARNDFTLIRAPEPVSYYLQEIRKRFAYNQMKERLPKMSVAMQNVDVGEVETLMRECLNNIGSTLRPRSYSTLASAMDLVLDDYEYAKEHPGLRGITFGWPTADDVTLGAAGGDLVVIAGRPSMGKSWLLEHMAYAAQLDGKSSIIVSMEMPIMQMARRRVAKASGINPTLIRAGQLSKMGEQKLYDEVEKLKHSAAPVHFLSGDMNKEVQGIADMADEYQPDAIYIDAAYLLSPTMRQRGGYASKWEQLSDVIHELKSLALAINRPIIMTVQFNRNLRKNSTRRSDLSDIAGTDTIPQDASIVLGVRPGLSPFEKTKRQIDMLKDREGETKDFVVNFSFYPINFDETTYPVQSGQTPGVIASNDWMI